MRQAPLNGVKLVPKHMSGLIVTILRFFLVKLLNNILIVTKTILWARYCLEQ